MHINLVFTYQAYLAPTHTYTSQLFIGYHPYRLSYVMARSSGLERLCVGKFPICLNYVEIDNKDDAMMHSRQCYIIWL